MFFTPSGSYWLVVLGRDVEREHTTSISDAPDVHVEDHAVVLAYTCHANLLSASTVHVQKRREPGARTCDGRRRDDVAVEELEETLVRHEHAVHFFGVIML